MENNNLELFPTTANNFVSFFDLIKSIEEDEYWDEIHSDPKNLTALRKNKGKFKVDFSDVVHDKFKSYVTHFNKLDQQIEIHRNFLISQHWSKIESEQGSEYCFEWIDANKLEALKTEILKHKDKQHTRCFDTLTLHKKALIPEDFSIFDQLDKELPNFKEVTAFYRGAFAMNKSREASKYQAPRPILLLGNPGIGKTHYAKRFAQLLKSSYRFFDSNSITGGWVLTGNNATWRGADAGLIFSELAKSDTISPVILLDEIDKIKAEAIHSPFSVFHQLFEKENAKEFYDEFVGMSFDASQIVYILTANDVSSIAPSLLSRMNIFNIENPTEDEMKPVIQTIYNNLLDGSTLFSKKLSVNEVNKLVTFAPRDVTQILSKNIYDQASAISINGIEQNNVLNINVNKKEKGRIGFC